MTTPFPTRDFDLGDVLSVTTGRLVSARHMDGFRDILDWMSGEMPATHQIPRIGAEAAAVLGALYPHLTKDALKEDLDELKRLLAVASRDPARCQGVVDGWVARLARTHGASLPVPRMDADQHERIDALSELAEKVPPDRIVKI
jgi:hypothetical protein